MSSLPNTETFVSHTNNALKLNSVTVNSNSFTIIVPSLSTTAILLKSTSTLTGIRTVRDQADEMKIFPNPASDHLTVSISSNVAEPTEITIYDQGGRKVTTSIQNYDGTSPINSSSLNLSVGYYLLSVKNSRCSATKGFCVVK